MISDEKELTILKEKISPTISNSDYEANIS